MNFWTSQPALHAPGVSVSTTVASRASGAVRMDVAGLIGLCARGPVGQALVLESWADFLREFGRPGGHRQLPEAVHHFFLNGGRRCVVVRAISPDATTASGLLHALGDPDGAAISFAAPDPGAWANRLRGRLTVERTALTVRLDTTSSAPRLLTTDPTVQTGSLLRRSYVKEAATGTSTLKEQLFFVVALEEAGGEVALTLLQVHGEPHGLDHTGSDRFEHLSGRLTLSVPGDLDEHYSGLGFHRDHPRFLVSLLNEESRLLRLFLANEHHFVLPSFHPDPSFAPSTPGTDAEATTTRSDFFRDFSSLDALRNYEESGQGLDPISMVAIPDLVHPPYSPPPAADLDEVILDEEPLRFRPCNNADTTAPPGDNDSTRYPHLAADGLSLSALIDDMQRLVQWCEARRYCLAILDLPPGLTAQAISSCQRTLRSKNAALYGPWLRGSSAGSPRAELRLFPPSGSVCGALAKAIQKRGPGAPAANLALRGVLSPAVDEEHTPQAYFSRRVNEIRIEEGQVMLMGSRTTGGDDWQGHLPVQRVLHFLSRQLPIDAAWAPFEPNNHRLWRRLTLTIRKRLEALFAQNALSGATTDEAFFVRCDDRVNPSALQDAGRVEALIGVAVAVPNEFLHLRLALQSDGRVLLQEAR